VVPVCFAWLPPYIYTAIDGKPKRTMLLRRVRNITETGRASLVVDRWSEDWKNLSYVLVEGPAEMLEDGRERDEALILLTAKYPQYDDLPLAGNLVIKLTAERTVEWHA
jgi:PPOX class probable F420-dependent enzyme